MDGLTPGQKYGPLAPGQWVMRLSTIAFYAMDGPRTVSPKAFDFSSRERDDPRPLLSVWAVNCTTPDQAWILSGSKPEKCLVLYLSVDEIRALRTDCGVSPEVEWEPALDENELPLTAPGADGHAGIANLDKPTRPNRRLLRAKLADLARKRVVILQSILEETKEGVNPNAVTNRI